MHLQENKLFDLDLVEGVSQYPLHHVTYSPAKFELAMSNWLRGGPFTRNSGTPRMYILMHTHTYARTHAHKNTCTDRRRRTCFGTKLKINIPFFMPPKELWEAYSNPTVRPPLRLSRFMSRAYHLYSLTCRTEFIWK